MAGMITKTDRRIMYYLLENARMPDSAIAKKMATSKQVIGYRLKRLEKINALTGYRAKINSSLLGFSTFGVYLQLNKATDEKFLIDELKKNPFVRWIVSCTGKWDLIFSISARDIGHFHSILHKIMAKAEKYIKSYDTNIFLYTKDFIPEFVFEFGRKEEPALKELHEGKTIKLDKKDVMLLDILQNTARMPILLISQKLGISPYAVRYKIKSLIQSGVINQFKPSINYEALGYGWYQILIHTKNLSEKEEKYFLETLRTIKGVTYILKCIGKWNFEIIMNVQDNWKFRESLLELRTKLSDYILSYDTLIIFRNYKRQTLPEGVIAELMKG
jgi:DNA-binding Lrp family transcriptional regulator